MDLDNGIILEFLQTELIILMVKVTRIVGDLLSVVGDFLSETNSLTEMVEASKEVTTPTHKTETDRKIGSSLALHKSREQTPPNTTQGSGHDPSKPVSLVFRTRITNKAQASPHMNRSSHNTIVKRRLM